MRCNYPWQWGLGGAALFLVLLAVYIGHGRYAIEPTPITPSTFSVGRLKIPAIAVDTPLEQVGLTSDGAMDTPEGPNTAGWYSLGPYPGEAGSAVIAGHRGWKNGVPAVFDDLDTLQVGDSILVLDRAGAEHTFVVRETRVYGRDSIVPEAFVSTSGVHLNLITCVGTWDPELQSSEERLVVFSDLVH